MTGLLQCSEPWTISSGSATCGGDLSSVSAWEALDSFTVDQLNVDSLMVFFGTGFALTATVLSVALAASLLLRAIRG